MRNTDDANELQNVMNQLHDWCIVNELNRNIEKCSVMTISHKRDPLIYDYMLNGNQLKRDTKHKDLGVLFDSKMDFNEHIGSITSKASSALGFVKRFCYDLNATSR